MSKILETSQTMSGKQLSRVHFISIFRKSTVLVQTYKCTLQNSVVSGEWYHRPRKIHVQIHQGKYANIHSMIATE